MQLSQVNDAVAAFLAAYDGNAADSVATIVEEAKASMSARKGMQQSLFAGFLALAATGASVTSIRESGAIIRERVKRILRERAGFAPVKAKGAKESGAPDFSTASVYAKLVGDMLTARRASAATWTRAVELSGSVEKPISLHPQVNLPDSVGAARRVLAKFDELHAEASKPEPAIAEAAARLWGPSEAAQAATREASLMREVAELADELERTRATLAAMQAAQAQREPAQA